MPDASPTPDTAPASPESRVASRGSPSTGNPSTFPCTQCGAELEFKPGTRSLTCPYCQTLNEIPADDRVIEEVDYTKMLGELEGEKADHEHMDVHCDSCGANVPMASNTTSQACPFCGSNIVATAKSVKQIKPAAILPFAISQQQASSKFSDWLSSRWFAPGDLKRYASMEGDEAYKSAGGLAGLYLPYWTYDARSTTPYTGQRGDDYYVTVPTTVMVNGKPTTRLVQQRRTRWTWVQGTVQNAFDDVLVPASNSLPSDKLHEIGSWDMKAITPYRDEFLSGFRAESYTVRLPQGFTAARAIMEETIAGTIRSDIGGDHQRIQSMHPQYRDITFKHILLPIWVSAYRYREKVYRFLVNGRTGAIAGERPYSAWKITLFVLACLIVLGVVIAIVQMR